MDETARTTTVLPSVVATLLGTPIDHVMSTPNWLATGMRVTLTHPRGRSLSRPNEGDSAANDGTQCPAHSLRGNLLHLD